MPYYREKALAYRGKAGPNTDTDFLAVRLGVVLHLLIKKQAEKSPFEFAFVS